MVGYKYTQTLISELFTFNLTHLKPEILICVNVSIVIHSMLDRLRDSLKLEF